MTAFQAVVTNQSTLENTSIVNGRTYFVRDSERLFFDLNNTRTEIRDIIILDTEDDRDDLIAPKNKFYFVLGSSKLYLYHNGTWYNAGGSCSHETSCLHTIPVLSISGNATLSANSVYKVSPEGDVDIEFEDWVANRQCEITIYIDATINCNVTFPSMIRWRDEVTPNVVAGNSYIIKFSSIDGGTTIYASFETYTPVPVTVPAGAAEGEDVGDGPDLDDLLDGDDDDGTPVEEGASYTEEEFDDP